MKGIKKFSEIPRCWFHILRSKERDINNWWEVQESERYQTITYSRKRFSQPICQVHKKILEKTLLREVTVISIAKDLWIDFWCANFALPEQTQNIFFEWAENVCYWAWQFTACWTVSQEYIDIFLTSWFTFKRKNGDMIWGSIIEETILYAPNKWKVLVANFN